MTFRKRFCSLNHGIKWKILKFIDSINKQLSSDSLKLLSLSHSLTHLFLLCTIYFLLLIPFRYQILSIIFHIDVNEENDNFDFTATSFLKWEFISNQIFWYPDRICQAKINVIQTIRWLMILLADKDIEWCWLFFEC